MKILPNLWQTHDNDKKDNKSDNNNDNNNNNNNNNNDYNNDNENNNDNDNNNNDYNNDNNNGDDDDGDKDGDEDNGNGINISKSQKWLPDLTVRWDNIGLSFAVFGVVGNLSFSSCAVVCNTCFNIMVYQVGAE